MDTSRLGENTRSVRAGERLDRAVGTKVRYAGRDAASSPAAGSKAMHYREQKALLEHAFSI